MYVFMYARMHVCMYVCMNVRSRRAEGLRRRVFTSKRLDQTDRERDRARGCRIPGNRLVVGPSTRIPKPETSSPIPGTRNPEPDPRIPKRKTRVGGLRRLLARPREVATTLTPPPFSSSSSTTCVLNHHHFYAMFCMQGLNVLDCSNHPDIPQIQPNTRNDRETGWWPQLPNPAQKKAKP